ncbi:hypothetical protein PP175_28670 (plasmid) [Aneurinibacillus sp. Ricciae_BoGa-3]|uniref:hypothetical protein n=1 Tax=Aneurinibacillus sp. Ricciae_BoGa-3 TaxID=3022697 RepID=UPI00233FC20E|nr:hypothetical protein [Aneurinibacillus sp. Ricciae_BoGa-3]WCK57164.1 hypothetical protein PP175_28670 [Aneurinibacillus sp. Ricciae_BoGa-3]
MQTTTLQYPTGTQVLCHACSNPLFVLTKDSASQVEVTKDLIKAIVPQKKPRDLNNAKCAHCGCRVLYSKLRVPSGTTYTYRMGQLVDVQEKEA